jgi:preprotein translocase subunit SecG
MFKFLLIVQMIVTAAMIGVILMQRSEGGGLGVGGNSSGLMTARGAADFLTRATAILATLFVGLSIVLAGLATVERAPIEIDPALAKQAPAPAGGTSPLAPGQVPLASDPLAGAAESAAQNQVVEQAPANGSVPLAQ